MECTSNEPSLKKIKLDCTCSKLETSLQNDNEIDQESSTSNPTWRSSPSSGEKQLQRPRAILHDKYYRSLEVGL